jgi:tRNA (guanine-N7-)-methyltransferase
MILSLASLDFPASAERIFGRTGPLVLEIGFGDGRFLAHLARRAPSSLRGRWSRR